MSFYGEGLGEYIFFRIVGEAGSWIASELVLNVGNSQYNNQWVYYYRLVGISISKKTITSVESNPGFLGVTISTCAT